MVPKTRLAASKLFSLIAPTTLAFVIMSFKARPGAARVGLYAKPKSTPAFKPEAFSNVSLIIVSVIPGPVVLATITKDPARNPLPISLLGLSINV